MTSTPHEPPRTVHRPRLQRVHPRGISLEELRALQTPEMRLAVSAYLGDWDVLLPLLAADPRQINVYREPRRYTPLHHAARHGAPPEVVGALLSLGADPCLLTASKQQRAFDIAVELHPSRLDLQYLLQPRRLSIAQLLRKAVAMSPGLFHEGDGNQRLFDRLVMSLDGPPDPDHATNIVVLAHPDGIEVISKGIGVGAGGRVGSVTYRDRLALTPQGWRIQERCCELRLPDAIPDPT